MVITCTKPVLIFLFRVWTIMNVPVRVLAAWGHLVTRSQRWTWHSCILTEDLCMLSVSKMSLFPVKNSDIKKGGSPAYSVSLTLFYLIWIEMILKIKNIIMFQLCKTMCFLPWDTKGAFLKNILVAVWWKWMKWQIRIIKPVHLSYKGIQLCDNVVVVVKCDIS